MTKNCRDLLDAYVRTSTVNGNSNIAGRSVIAVALTGYFGTVLFKYCTKFDA
jgi:hypothetical protein